MKIHLKFHEQEKLTELVLEMPTVPMEGNVIAIPVANLPQGWESIIFYGCPEQFRGKVYTTRSSLPGIAFIEFDATGIVVFMPDDDLGSYHPVVQVIPTSWNAFE